MKTRYILVFVAISLSSIFNCVAAPKICSMSDAAFIEENIGNVETWHTFSVFYRQYKQCDVSALKYAFTQKIAYLAANDMGMKELKKELTNQPYLKLIIVNHLKSDSITSDEKNQILENLKQCVDKRLHICSDIKKALNSL